MKDVEWMLNSFFSNSVPKAKEERHDEVDVKAPKDEDTKEPTPRQYISTVCMCMDVCMCMYVELTCMYSFTHSSHLHFAHLLACLLTHISIRTRSLTHSLCLLIHSLTHFLLTYSLTYSLTHSLTHSLTLTLTYSNSHSRTHSRTLSHHTTHSGM